MPDPYERLPDDDEAPEALLQDFKDYMAAAVPGWQPDDPAVEVALGAAFADEGSTLYDLLREEADDRYADFGAQILDVPAADPVSATAITEWTARDNAGYTLEAGQTLVIGGFGFEVVEETEIPNGSTVASGVEVRALDTGTEPNGAETPVQFDEPPAWVDTVTVTTAASGGTDGDTEEEHIARVRGEASLLSRAPIQADDYETVAQEEDEVARALVRDNYLPGTNEKHSVTIDATSGQWTFEPMDAGQVASALEWDITAEELQTALEALSNINPGDVIVTGGPGATAPLVVEFSGQYAEQNLTQSVTTDTLTGGAGTATVTTTVEGTAGQEDQDLAVAVYPIDDAGESVSAGTLTSLSTRYADRVIVNTIVSIGRPTYTDVDVDITVEADGTVSHDDLETRVAEAIADEILNPATFGLPPVGERLTWKFKDTIRQYEVAAIAARVEGVAFVDGPPLLGANGGATADADLVLDGAAPLPRAGAIDVTVNP